MGIVDVRIEEELDVRDVLGVGVATSRVGRFVRATEADQVRSEYPIPRIEQGWDHPTVEVAPGRLAVKQHHRMGILGPLVDVGHPQAVDRPVFWLVREVVEADEAFVRGSDVGDPVRWWCGASWDHGRHGLSTQGKNHRYRAAMSDEMNVVKTSRTPEELRGRLQAQAGRHDRRPRRGDRTSVVTGVERHVERIAFFDATWKGGQRLVRCSGRARGKRCPGLLPTYDLQKQYDLIDLVAKQSSVPVPALAWMGPIHRTSTSRSS